jgi:hypothetical protein
MALNSPPVIPPGQEVRGTINEVHSNGKAGQMHWGHGCSRRPNLLRRSRAGSTEAQGIALERAKTEKEVHGGGFSHL